MGIPEPVMNPIADHRPPGFGEGLAGRASCDEVDSGINDEGGKAFDLGGTGQVPVDSETGKVVAVGLDSLGVVIGGQDDVEAGLLQAETESTATAEQVSGQLGVWVASPDLPGEFQEIVRGLAVGPMWCEGQERAADQLHSVETLPVCCHAAPLPTA
jgi:hypothetical protein